MLLMAQMSAVIRRSRILDSQTGELDQPRKIALGACTEANRPSPSANSDCS